MAKKSSKGKKPKKRLLVPKVNVKSVRKRKKSVKGKVRKTNRYLQIRSAVSKYCKDTYGKPCPQKEMTRIYREMKDRYKEIPIDKVLDEIDFILGNKDRDKLPDALVTFDWFDLESALLRGDGLFFKSDDDIELDLSSMDLGVFNMKHGELALVYRDEIYGNLRNRTYEAEEVTGIGSPVPKFILDSDALGGKGKNRKFVWRLQDSYGLENYDWGSRKFEPRKGRTIPQKGVDKEVRLKEAQVKINSQREAALNRIDMLLEKGVINNKQYLEKYDEVMKKYESGGII